MATRRFSLDEDRLSLIPVDELRFDPENPRLVEHGGSEESLLATLWSEFAVKEVALSIAANGFWRYEPLVVAEEGSNLVVIEGNRRLAAVRLLRDDAARKRIGATDLPKISTERHNDLDTLPAIISTRRDSWQFIGFKHVNGPQQWQSYSKAQYIARVHNEFDVPISEIADTIGDTHQTALRLYRALMTLEQAESHNLWNREDRYKKHFSFSHLFVGLNSYSNIQKHIGLEGPPGDSKEPVDPENFPQLQELLLWMFGSKRDDIRPVVVSQNPHLRELDKALSTPNSLAAIQQGLPLSVAVDVAKGDTAKLREDLVAVRRLLQDCRGKVLTGFTGEKDMLALADEILTLSESIVDDMRVVVRRRRSSRRTGT